MRIVSGFRMAFGRVGPGEHRRNRLVAIVQGVASGIANRLVSVVIGLVSVPLTIGYLGAERYGVWALVASTIAWLRLADIGVGNGLNNAVASAFGEDRPDLVRAHVSTAFGLLASFAAILGVVAAIAWPWIDWNSLFNVKTEIAKAELGPAMAAAIGIFLVGFPLSVVSRTYVATQSAKLANYWGTAGTVGSLVALIIVTRTEGGLVWLVIAVSGVGVAVDAISGLYLFLRHKPMFAPRWSSMRRSSVSVIVNVGVQFFLIQIMALVVFETGNFVVAHFLGADQVPAYNLTYKLFGYTSLIQSILFNYIWVAYTEAIARGDIEWVRKSFRLNVLFSLGSTAAVALPLIFIARPFIHVWAGDAAVPTPELVRWMAAWTMINAFSSPYACLLAAAGRLRYQLVYSAFSTVTIIGLSLYLVRIWGSTGVIAAPVIAYLIFICIPIAFDVASLLKRLDRHAAVPDAGGAGAAA